MRRHRDDAASLTVLEAMSTGAAVIATAVGGTPEIVSHATNGLLVPAEDPQALAEAMMAVHHDRELREQLGANARATVLRRYTLSGQLTRTRSLYRQLAGPDRLQKTVGLNGDR